MSKNKFLGFSFWEKTVDVQLKFVYSKAIEKCPG
jgi:hypothetical protein